MVERGIDQLVIGFKGAGEMATGIACGLYRANIRKLFMMETEHPLAVRRKVAFCEAVHDKRKIVEGVEAVHVITPEEIERAWNAGRVPIVVDPGWGLIGQIKPDVVIDAIIAKKNLGTHRNEAELVIGLGPGFNAGVDVDLVIETNRGHDLGRIIHSGFAAPNTGVPGTIAGQNIKRVLRAPAGGMIETDYRIGDKVHCGECIGRVGGKEIIVGLDGVLRGLIRPGTLVHEGVKIGDVDPRGKTEYCPTISDKARAIGGAVLTAILSEFNKCKINYLPMRSVYAKAG